MEQEEEKNIIIEFQRKVLQEANCTAEMLAYLDEIDDDVFREYYCICALDGMTVEEIRRIDSIAVQDWRVKIKHIKEERLNFLENMFVPNSEMQKQISELHDKAGKVFQETEELRITLNATLQQTLDIQKNALMEQRESYQNSLAAKEELIKERDEKIQSLVNEIEQNKKTWQTEKKTLLLQLEEKKSSDEKAAKVVVPDYQLSLAIGKEGQNARLAARLTGFKIDIKRIDYNTIYRANRQ